MMASEEEFEHAHDVYDMYGRLVVSIGVELLRGLTPAQVEYVLLKMGDEFRFWSVEDKLRKGKSK